MNPSSWLSRAGRDLISPPTPLDQVSARIEHAEDSRSQRSVHVSKERSMKMAIGVYYGSLSMNAQQYDEVVKQLEAAGANSPKGRLHHSSFGDTNDLHVFDVWASQADFDAFGPVLMPILKSAGVTRGKPEIMPIHNIIKP